jgi:hypothetical protein
MRITGKQLRRIIQEEVARMVNEDDMGSVVGSSGTQAVAPVAVKGGKPDDFKKSLAGNLSFKLMALFGVTTAKPNPTAVVNEGDKVDILCELVGIKDVPDTGGIPGIQGSKTWSVASMSINGKNLAVPPGLRPRPAAGSEVPPGERMKFRVTFEVGYNLASALDENRNDPTGGTLEDVRYTLFNSIKDNIVAA